MQVDSAATSGTTIQNTTTVTSTTADTVQANNTSTVASSVAEETVPLECNVTTANVPGDPRTVELTDDADGFGGALIITGTSRNDAIVVIPYSTNRLRVLFSGKNVGTFDRSAVQHIVIFGGAGNDSIVINASLSIRSTLFGEDGNDVLVGAKGDDGLDGGSGNDVLYGLGGNDTICGEDGNDRIFGGNGNNNVGGDAGNDKVFGENGSDLVLGGDGNNCLYGGTGNDQLFGQAGNDQMFGESSNDSLAGGDGNDKLFGGAGNDLLIGGNGNDQLYGDAGDDVLISGTTANDEDAEALAAIVSELGARRSVNNRINNLRFGSGNNGDVTLDDASVVDDGSNDTLYGGAGTDWFFTGLGDKVRGPHRNEQVN